MSKNYTAKEKDLKDKFHLCKQRREYWERKWDQWGLAYQRLIREYISERENSPLLTPYGITSTIAESTALSDIRLPVEFSIIIRKAAEFMKNMPRPSWISMDQSEKDKHKRGQLFGHLFDWVWYEANGDIEMFKVVLSMLIFGDAVAWVFHEKRVCSCKTPYLDENGEVAFKEDKKYISKTKFKNIDIRNFFYDPSASSIEDADYAFVVEYYTPDKAKKIFEKEVKRWDKFKTVNQKVETSDYETPEEERTGQYGEFYIVKHYYNQTLDEYTITIDDYIVKESAIPQMPDDGEKRIPVAVFQDHIIPNELYAMSECEILKPRREIKNNIVNLVFDVSRQAAYGTLVVDPYADFDEDSFQWGQDFLRVEPGLIDQLRSDANLSWVNQFNQENENGITVDTGIDHRNTISTPNETATQTLERKESQLQIVELNIKWNAYTGFKRLYLLMKDLIRLHYKSYPVVEGPAKKRKVRIKDEKFVRNAMGMDNEPSKGYNYFDIEPEDLEGDFDLVLNIGNIAMTTALKRSMQTEAVQQITQLPPEVDAQGAQKPVYSSAGIARFLADFADLPESILSEDIRKDETDLEAEAIDGLILPNQQEDGIPQPSLPADLQSALQRSAPPIEGGEGPNAEGVQAGAGQAPQGAGQTPGAVQGLPAGLPTAGAV